MAQEVFGQNLHRHPKHRVKSQTNEQGKKALWVIPLFAASEVITGGFINGKTQEDSLHSLRHTLAFQNSTLHKTFLSTPTLYFQFKDVVFKRKEKTTSPISAVLQAHSN